MFTKILIANRGEIACRVAATARRLGIRTVAVYSDADARSRHVAACDEAYRLGPAPARESYLRGDEVVRIALACGAQAIHPGYGFLSENEAFAQAVADAGLVFIGPPASAIAAMGSKSAAKTLMATASVPLVPGYHGDNQDPVYLKGQADAIGYPVLIKASAGGGGKGMRIVNAGAEFDANLASCKREAKNAFSDDTVLIERYVQRPRHIEIQVFGDTHGNCVYLFERDCSVQRRHQKVIEEAPAPGMSAQRRQAMGEAAVAAARAVNYVGAGTVEFISDPDGRFFFMEMNTRLQVEHPVTEMITGHDLVEWQLRVAAGEPLPVTQAALQIEGHSVEVRVYAENPDKGFLPSTGQLRHLRTPAAVGFSIGAAGASSATAAAGATGAASATRAAVRIDSGVREGDAISPFYDPMIAKLITWAPDRAGAIAQMTAALARFEVVGLHTNIAFLRRLMRCDSFAQADLDTGLIERERAVLLPGARAPSARELALAAGTVLALEARAAAQAADAHDPWQRRSGWRIGEHLDRELVFLAKGEPVAVRARYAAGGYTIQVGDEAICLAELRWDPTTRRLSGLAGSEAFDCGAVLDGETLHLFGPDGQVSLGYRPVLSDTGEEQDEAGSLTAPMPGKVIALLVAKGAKVSRGQPLVVMEAMKMEHTIAAPADGEVTAILYQVGDQVGEGAALIALQAS